MKKLPTLILLAVIGVGLVTFFLVRSVYVIPKLELTEAINSVPIYPLFVDRSTGLLMFSMGGGPTSSAHKLLVTDEKEVDVNTILDFYEKWARENGWKIIEKKYLNLNSSYPQPSLMISKGRIKNAKISIDVGTFISGSSSFYAGADLKRALTQKDFIKENKKWFININLPYDRS